MILAVLRATDTVRVTLSNTNAQFCIICKIPCRIMTCCCCPRNYNSHLYVTTHRMITSAQTLVPCCNIPLQNYVEYYSLNRILRVRYRKSAECNCLGCCACCQGESAIALPSPSPFLLISLLTHASLACLPRSELYRRFHRPLL